MFERTILYTQVSYGVDDNVVASFDGARFR